MQGSLVVNAQADGSGSFGTKAIAKADRLHQVAVGRKRSAGNVAKQDLTPPFRAKPAVAAALREKQAEVSAGLESTRDGVIRGSLEAYEMAKTDRNPAVMVSATASIAKLLGFYAVETKRIEVSAEGQGANRVIRSTSHTHPALSLRLR